MNLGKKSLYCDCMCPYCSSHEREWLLLYSDSISYHDFFCRKCKKIVHGKCIPLEMRYLW